jgi:hypothetical protein
MYNNNNEETNKKNVWIIMRKNNEKQSVYMQPRRGCSPSVYIYTYIVR